MKEPIYNNDLNSLLSSQQTSILAEGQGSSESSKNHKKDPKNDSGKFSYTHESIPRKREDASSSLVD